MSHLLDIRRRLERNGPTRARDLQDWGAKPEQLRRWVENGELVRLARGIYSVPNYQSGEHQSLIEACLRSRHGVICLVSALSFHGVTSQNPSEVWLALPQGSRTPHWREIGLRVVHLSAKFHMADVETHDLPDGTVRVYSLVRTLVEAFKFRGIVGLDVVFEAIRESVRTKRVTWDEIHLAAKARGVAGSIRPYLEAL